MSAILDAETRQRLRREVDRVRRRRIGEKLRSDTWVSIPEAAGIVGVKATTLRVRVRALGLTTTKQGNLRLIQVTDLDRLRED